MQAGLEKWLSGLIPLDSVAAPPGKPLFEFVVANAARDSWDKPPAGGNYTVTTPGVYSLRGGRLRSITGPAAMVVS